MSQISTRYSSLYSKKRKPRTKKKRDRKEKKEECLSLKFNVSDATDRSIVILFSSKFYTGDDILRIESFLKELRDSMTLDYNLDEPNMVPTSMVIPYQISKRVKDLTDAKIKCLSLYHKNLIDCVKGAKDLVVNMVSNYVNGKKNYFDSMNSIKESWTSKVESMVKKDASDINSKLKSDWNQLISEYNQENGDSKFVPLKGEPMGIQIERFMKDMYSINSFENDSKSVMLNETTVRLEELVQQYNEQKGIIGCNKYESDLSKRLNNSSRERIMNVVDQRRMHIESMLSGINQNFQKQYSYKKLKSTFLERAQDIMCKLTNHKLNDNKSITQWKMKDLIDSEINSNKELYKNSSEMNLNNELKSSIVMLTSNKNKIDDTYDKYTRQINNDYQLLMNELVTVMNSSSKSVKAQIKKFMDQNEKYFIENCKNINNKTIFHLLQTLSPLVRKFPSEQN